VLRQHLRASYLSTQLLEIKAIGNGSKRAPFKTITQALRIAQPNAVIVLYRHLALPPVRRFLDPRPGVSIQGDPRTRGRILSLKVVLSSVPRSPVKTQFLGQTALLFGECDQS